MSLSTGGTSKMIKIMYAQTCNYVNYINHFFEMYVYINAPSEVSTTNFPYLVKTTHSIMW
jgi:hypothetical protein